MSKSDAPKSAGNQISVPREVIAAWRSASSITAKWLINNGLWADSIEGDENNDDNDDIDPKKPR